MKTLEIAAKSDPRRVYQSASTHTTAQTTRNGDVEIVANVLGGGQEILVVIPKSKRAALAEFLVNAQ